MSASDPAPSKHVINMLDLESAILDAQCNALLLELAIDNMGGGDAWSFLGREPKQGYRLYLLTNDQVRAIHHAVSLVLSSTLEASIQFHGHDLAHSA